MNYNFIKELLNRTQELIEKMEKREETKQSIVYKNAPKTWEWDKIETYKQSLNKKDLELYNIAINDSYITQAEFNRFRIMLQKELIKLLKHINKI